MKKWIGFIVLVGSIIFLTACSEESRLYEETITKSVKYIEEGEFEKALSTLAIAEDEASPKAKEFKNLQLATEQLKRAKEERQVGQLERAEKLLQPVMKDERKEIQVIRETMLEEVTTLRKQIDTFQSEIAKGNKACQQKQFTQSSETYEELLKSLPEDVAFERLKVEATTQLDSCRQQQEKYEEERRIAEQKKREEEKRVAEQKQTAERQQQNISSQEKSPSVEQGTTSNSQQQYKNKGREFGERLRDPNLTPAERQRIIQEKKEYYRNQYR